ncbi:MAG TPA: GMC family oxidoreductase [Egibacteraceae bacterium]|nr:GMC family oxidoreductase [Egibacteraceae bacterium]
MAVTGGLRGLCATLLPPEHGGPDPSVLAGQVAAYLDAAPGRVRLGMLAAAAALDGLALASRRRRLVDLAPGERVRVLESLASRSPEVEQALLGLKAAVLLVAGTEQYRDELNREAGATDLANPEPELDVVPASDWPDGVTADVVVVGSGAGGAMAARTLARAGMRVLVLEEGRRWSVEEFRTGHPLERFAGLYRDAGTTTALGRPPVVLPIGRAVGGTTVVNSGTCYRTPAAVQDAWRAKGVATEDFEARLDEAEATFKVAPAPLDVLGRNGHLALAGARALGWQAAPLRRNAPGCGGCCQCAIGCPRNAKYGVHLNALPQACEAGARIVSDAHVTRIVVEGGRAAGVRARRPDGSEFTVRAPRVVMACGTTESPHLLWRSGLGSHPEVGRHLAIHPAIGIAGRFAEPVVAWKGVLQSAGVEEFHHSDGILIEATSTPPGMGSVTLPGYGVELLRELDQADHLATIGALVADDGNGRVVGRRGGRKLIRYDLGERDAGRLRKAVTVMGELLLAAGAEEILTGIPGVPAARTVEGLRDAVWDVPARRLHLAAFHPTGTLAMGADAQRYPVDPGGRLRGVDGVWVADGSILPSSPTVNPQITIMALALGVAADVAATP